MSKTRFSTLVLSLALVLATATAVVAQEEEASPEAATTEQTFDPASVPEFNQDEALAAYAIFREELLAMGVAEEDLAEATAYLESEAQAEMTDEADEVAEEVTEAEEEVQDEKDEAKEELEEEKEEVKEEIG
jgi:hypothetical protein